MSQELKVTIGVTYQNLTLKDTVPTAQTAINQSAQEEFSPVISVPTSDTALTLSNITTPAWIYMLNLDTTNYVQYGPTSGGALVPYGRLNPGEPAILRLDPGVSMRWKANGSPVKVLLKAWGN